MTPLLDALRIGSDYTPIAHDTDATRAGCKVLSGFDPTLDGFADELIWDRTMGGKFAQVTAVARSAPYRWAILVGSTIIDYVEGDVYIIECPSTAEASVQFSKVEEWIES